MLLPEPVSPATRTRSPWCDRHLGSLDHRGAVVERHRQIAQPQRDLVGPAAPDPADAVGAFRAFQRVERGHQRGDARRRRRPIGEPRVVVDQPVERRLHDREGRNRLHDLAKRHRAVEKLGGAQDDRQHRDDVAAGLRDHRGAHGLDAEVAPAAQHGGHRAVDGAALLRFAAEHGDALAILAQPGEHVAVLGLGLVLPFGDIDQAAADENHQAARHHRIEHRGDHQESRDGDGDAAELDRQRAADRPQHPDEGHRQQNCVEHAGREIDRRIGRAAHVVGDAVFRVLVIPADQIELVIAAVPQPAIEQVIVQPGAPAPLRGHARVDLGDDQQNACHQQREIDQRQEQDGAAVALLQRVEDRPVPDVHPIGGGEIEQDGEQDQPGQQPGEPGTVLAPIAFGGSPEPPQQTRDA